MHAGLGGRRSNIPLADLGDRVSGRGTWPETHSLQLCSLDFGTGRVICTCASGDERTGRSALNVLVFEVFEVFCFCLVLFFFEVFEVWCFLIVSDVF